MAVAYLDKTGLTHLWAKVKAYFASTFVKGNYVTVNASNYSDQQLNISIPNVELTTGLVINIRPSIDIDDVWAIKLNNEATYAIYPAAQGLNMKADRVYSFVYDFVGSGMAWHLLRGDTRIKLNNSETSTPDFYAPTTAGTAGYVLQSTGAVPSWKVGGEFIHIVKNPSGTAGNTASGSYNRTQWTGTVDGITELYDGLTVQFKVPISGVARGDTLNINSLGEHPVVLQASTLVTTNYPIGSIIILVYDSTQKASVYVNNVNTQFTGCWKTYDNNTTYANYSLGHGFGTCTPPTSGVACTVTLASYSLLSGGITAIKFSTNPVPANATFNINNKGAKPVYYNGAAIGANVIKAGDIATFMYNGTQYNLLAIDRNIGDAAAIDTSSVDGLKIRGNNTRYVTVDASDLMIDTLLVSSVVNGTALGSVITVRPLVNLSGVAYMLVTAAGATAKPITGLNSLGEMNQNCCYSFVLTEAGWFLIGQQYDTLTQSQIEAGSNTEGRLVSAKLMMDIIAELESNYIGYAFVLHAARLSGMSVILSEPNPEWRTLLLDNDNRILLGMKQDGTSVAYVDAGVVMEMLADYFDNNLWE